MSVTGVSPSTLNGERSASTDGVDDFGVAPGLASLPQTEALGMAMVFKSSDKSDSEFFGLFNSNIRFEVADKSFFSGSNGRISVSFADTNDNFLEEETDSIFVDGNVHLVVINKLKNTGTNAINFYVDDMNTPTASTTQTDTGFSNSAYPSTADLPFFARSSSGSIDRHKDINTSFIEFNSQPYSSTERQELLKRAPGV
jgi:hypothetical protein